ncbi:proteobacterial dedicated sortase system histidine kinase [Algicola sagamiensis]|uniref:proteobacterial dedicated sortase system histidine kinase n=1 Tax=Algicola sagamiensis TaxID=163869 RepID=UPI000365F5A3|nr:proteobacterial dedicated sortase system histidine kinase [Algicola sagamiensis]
MLKFPFGLRTKFIILSSFLFSLPWLGYQYVWEVEKYLRKGQEKTLLGTVRAVATALHERPKLFDHQASFLKQVKRGRDLYAYALPTPIQLDGDHTDWPNFTSRSYAYGGDHIIRNIPPYQESSLSFRHTMGKYGEYLYAFFEVTDDRVIYRQKNSLRVDRNDFLQIAMMTPEQKFQRYIIATPKAGWVNAFELPEDSFSLRASSLEKRIQGQWKQTEHGYNIELRIPLNLVGEQMGFAISDVDDPKRRQISAVIGTSNPQYATLLGSVLVPSPEIERIIKGMGHTSSRIWVVDKHQRVLARSGDIRVSNGVWGNALDEANSPDWWRWIETNLLHPVYYKILTKPPSDFVDQLYDSARLEGSHIHTALKGQSKSTWRLSSDHRAVILSAAYPIWIDNQVMGAVIAEETTNGIRTLRNKALEKLFNVILAIMLVGTFILFLFASRISHRILKLRDEAESIIDENGRLTRQMEQTKAKDEIGDLSRSFSNMVQRLWQYTHYLENMSSRLSHELRTPVTVVRSSLENLAMQPLDDESKIYMERAKEGVSRLSTILTNMSEATRLEQSLRDEEKIKFALDEVVTGCVQGYQFAYPDHKIILDCKVEGLMMQGVPDAIAQLLDKVVANAMEFSITECPIRIGLSQSQQEAKIRISNEGPYLPDEMKDRIFEPMVSVRKKQTDKQPHLGIGLYIAQLITTFHKGKICAENRTDCEGVTVIVSLPLD